MLNVECMKKDLGSKLPSCHPRIAATVSGLQLLERFEKILSPSLFDQTRVGHSFKHVNKDFDLWGSY